MSTIYFQRLLFAAPAVVAITPLDVCLAIVVLRAAVATGALEIYEALGGRLIPGRYARWSRGAVVLALEYGRRRLSVRARCILHATLRAFGPAPRRLP